MDITNISFMFKGIVYGLAVCGGVGWVGIWIARKAGLIDIPGTTPHKRHAAPTPLAGGITLILSLIFLVFVTGLWKERQFLVVLIGGLIIFGFGLWDDKRNLSVPIKLIGQIIGAVLVMSFGVNIGFLEFPFIIFMNTNPMILVWADRLLTLLWIVGITNAFNLVDSMDGLAVGLSGLAFAFFMLVSISFEQFSISYLLAILLGICFGLLYYNAPPAKLFLGDSGAQTLGFLLATLSILFTPVAAFQSSTWFIPILLLGVPIFDTSLVFFSRLRRRIPFYTAGNDHTYHRLIRMGMNSNHAVLAINFSALILNCVAFTAMTMEPLFANLLFAACLLMGMLAMYFFEIKQVGKPV